MQGCSEPHWRHSCTPRASERLFSGWQLVVLPPELQIHTRELRGGSIWPSYLARRANNFQSDRFSTEAVDARTPKTKRFFCANLYAFTIDSEIASAN